jgi:ribosomal protein S27E
MKRTKRTRRELGEIKIDDLVQKRDDGTYISFKNLHDIARAFEKQAGFALSRKMIHVVDADEIPEKYNKAAASSLRTDIEQIISESDDPIKCEDCGNQEEFYVFVSEFHLDLENGRDVKNLEIENYDSMWKPDTIVFICRKCGKVVVESSV